VFVLVLVKLVLVLLELLVLLDDVDVFELVDVFEERSTIEAFVVEDEVFVELVKFVVDV
jgi:hypothetical protein